MTEQPDGDACLADLIRPVGERGSGAARYAAAMYFYNEGTLSSGMLEVYRMCSKFDAEDPISVAVYEGISVPDFVLATMQDTSK